MPNLSDRPIFVVGAPRSGTTLMRSIIDAHPNICCPVWETGIFEKLATIVNGDIKLHLEKSPNFPMKRSDLLQWCQRSVEDLMHCLVSEIGKPRWAEKTPAHVFHIDLIHEIFPQAQFIHMIRNGRDVVRSLQNMLFGPRDIRWSTKRWIESVQAGRVSGEKLPKGQYLEIRYEDLLRNPEQILKQLCEFVREPWMPQMLDFHKPENNSWHLKHQPFQEKPIHNYRKLRLFEKIIFSWYAFRLMQELGYR